MPEEIGEIITDIPEQEIIDVFRDSVLSISPDEAIDSLFDSMKDMVRKDELYDIYASIGYDPDEEDLDDLMNEHTVEDEIFDVIKDWFFVKDDISQSLYSHSQMKIESGRGNKGMGWVIR